MWDYYVGHMFGWGIFGWFTMIAFWVAVAWILVWALRSAGASDRRGSSALDILKERYAKGEISRAEFESKKKDIET